VNQQVKSKLNAVKDFLAGRSNEPEQIAMGTDYDSQDSSQRTDATEKSQTADDLSHKSARQGFIDESYFEDTLESLRPGRPSAERVSAARALGLIGSERATPHLIAATFDDDPELRAAAEEALELIANPKPDFVVADTASIPQNEPTVETISSESFEAEPVNEQQEFPSLAKEPAESDTQPNFSQQLQPDAAPAVSLTEEEEETLRLERQTIEERLAAVNDQILAVIAAHREAETEARWRIEREAQLRTEAIARIVQEEEQRKQAEREIQERRAQELQAIAIEHDARIKAESDLEQRVTEERSLRLQFTDLNGALSDHERRRVDLELAKHKARHEAEREALRQEQETLKRVTEELRDQQEQLKLDIEHVREAGEQVARQRAEVKAAREKAEDEAQQFAIALARMREAEEESAKAERERMQLETEIHRQLEEHRRELEEARLRQQQEHDRVEEEVRVQLAKAQAHFEEVRAMKARADAESNEFEEKEKDVLGEIDSLRILDSEARRRIAEAEAKRRATEDAYNLIAEKVQRVEAEAHTRTKEEEQMLARLEAERRRVAVEAQSRADQEKRIRDEIEMFRRLEAEERPRIEAATLQLAEVERRVADQKSRLRELAETTEEAHSTHYENIAQAFATPGTYNEDQAAPTVSPTISNYLNSVDPYKRAAAVTELARTNSPDAFQRITECFDDHSAHVRNAAARALCKLEPARSVDLFNRALEQASPERRRSIGAAIAGSGIASEAITNLGSDSREDNFNALSILFVMAKTGEVEPLVTALQEHRDDEVGRAVTKLLTLSSHHTPSTGERTNAALASGGSEGN
jgi:HEAT repeat protein